MRLRGGYFAMLALSALSCARPPRAPVQESPLVALLSDAVVVLPVHEIALGERATTSGGADSIGRMFDAAFRAALQGDVAETWRWPADLAALRRRNPLTVPDPFRLPTQTVRGSRLDVEAQLPQQLGSDIRTLLAVAGGRRFAILPIHLHGGAASRGGYAAGVTLVVVDSRRAVISDVRTVSTGEMGATGPAPPPTSVLIARLAALARAALTGAGAQ